MYYPAYVPPVYIDASTYVSNPTYVESDVIEVIEPFEDLLDEETTYPRDDDEARGPTTPTPLHQALADGARLFEQGRYEEAGRRFNEVALSDPANVDAQLALAVAQFATGDHQSSAASIRRGISLSPDIVNSVFDIRDEYGNDEDFDRHLRGLEERVEAQQDDIDAHVVLGFVYHFTGQRPWAAEVFKFVKAASPEDADLADVFLNASQPSKSTPDSTGDSTEPAPEPLEESTPSTRRSKVYEGRISGDDDVAPEEVYTVNGIVVELDDTDDDPLTADLEIRVGDSEEEYEDVRPFVPFPILDIADRLHWLEVIYIDDDTETVVFTLSR